MKTHAPKPDLPYSMTASNTLSMSFNLKESGITYVVSYRIFECRSQGRYPAYLVTRLCLGAPVKSRFMPQWAVQVVLKSMDDR